MASRAKLVLMAVAILVIGFGVVDSQARRHRHKNSVRVIVTGSIPLNSGQVVGRQVNCPLGYRATGGGYNVAPPVVPDTPVDQPTRTAYQVIVTNPTNDNTTFTARVVCLKRRTTATRASNADTKAALAREVKQFQAALDAQRGH